MRLHILLSCLVLTVGCAPTFTAVGKDKWMTSAHGAMQADYQFRTAVENGTRFCAAKGQKFELADSHLDPLLGGATITFTCR